MQLFLKMLSGMADSADPDQTAPGGAVWSGSSLFAYNILSATLVFEILGYLPYSKMKESPHNGSTFFFFSSKPLFRKETQLWQSCLPWKCIHSHLLKVTIIIILFILNNRLWFYFFRVKFFWFYFFCHFWFYFFCHFSFCFFFPFSFYFFFDYCRLTLRWICIIWHLLCFWWCFFIVLFNYWKQQEKFNENSSCSDSPSINAFSQPCLKVP